MSDNDINTLKRMPLENILASEYWTEKLRVFSKTFDFKFGFIVKEKSKGVIFNAR